MRVEKSAQVRLHPARSRDPTTLTLSLVGTCHWVFPEPSRVTEMPTLSSGERLITNSREGRASPCIFDPGPRQTWVEVVTSIHEHRPELKLRSERLRG